MTVRFVCRVTVVAVLLGCTPAEPEPGPGLDLEAMLLEPPSAGNWNVAESVATYSPGTLWEYVDGGAPRYEDYGFEQLFHVRHQLGDDPLASVTVDLHDMGSELGAFGIYRSIRPPDAEDRLWGAEGYRSGTVAAA